MGIQEIYTLLGEFSTVLLSQGLTRLASSANWTVYKTNSSGQYTSGVTYFRVALLTGPGLNYASVHAVPSSWGHYPSVEVSCKTASDKLHQKVGV